MISNKCKYAIKALVVNTKKASYKENYAEMERLVQELHEHLEKSKHQGSEASISRARKRGKFLARERITLLLDTDSPFLEVHEKAVLWIMQRV